MQMTWSEKFNLVCQTALTWRPGRETGSHSGMLIHTHGKRPWVRCSSIPVSPWPQWSSAHLYQCNGDPISKTWKYQGIWVRGLYYNTSSRMYQNKQSNIMSISCLSANVMTWLLLRVQDVSNEGGQTNSFPAPDPLINVTWCDPHDTFLVMEWNTTPDTFQASKPISYPPEKWCLHTQCVSFAALKLHHSSATYWSQGVVAVSKWIWLVCILLEVALEGNCQLLEIASQRKVG